MQLKTKIDISGVLKRSLLLCLIAFFGAAASADGFEGPLHIKNSLPLFLAIGSPSLVSAECEDTINLNLTYSSTYLVDRSKDWSFMIDLEATVMDVQVKKLLGDSIEISLELPFISYNKGFMDGFLEAYHSAFGFPDYGRSERSLNDFLFDITQNGKTVVHGDSGEIAIGDLKIGIKKAVYLKDPYISIYGFLEFPTGDAEGGYGNGAMDGGIALLMNKAIGNRFMTYLNAGVVFTDRFAAEEEVRLRDYLYGGIGLEWIYSDRVSLNAQFFIQGSPFKETGVRGIDEIATILSIGGRYRMDSKSALEISFSEDPNTAGAPDFMVGIGYVYSF